MKTRNLLTLLILITAVCTSTVKAYGTAQVGQRLRTAAQPAVAIEKTAANETGTVDAGTGIHGGLNASFNLQTNGDDSSYDYILSSTIVPPSGISTSAFTKIGGQTGIVFINVDHMPNGVSISHAKTGTLQNPNCIVYPISMTINEPMTVQYVSNNATYGECWQVFVNGATNGTLSQVIGGTPIVNTYNLGDDATGSYRAVVTFTAVAK